MAPFPHHLQQCFLFICLFLLLFGLVLEGGIFNLYGQQVGHALKTLGFESKEISLSFDKYLLIVGSRTLPDIPASWEQMMQTLVQKEKTKSLEKEVASYPESRTGMPLFPGASYKEQMPAPADSTRYAAVCSCWAQLDTARGEASHPAIVKASPRFLCRTVLTGESHRDQPMPGWKRVFLDEQEPQENTGLFRTHQCYQITTRNKAMPTPLRAPLPARSLLDRCLQR